ncbi:MAG: hypothetical protein ACREDC_03575 [Bradyrhizobium sp.]
MTKAVTILALACVLVVGAVITGILCQGSLPSAGAEMPLAAVASMVPNRAAKQDKLTVAPIVVASLAPSHGTSLSEPLRQTSASADDADMEARKALTPAAPMVSAPIHESRRSERSKSEPPKRELASRPVRKSDALLSDAQIARIKERLKLSSSQEYYWPPVAAALRAIARKARAAHRAHPNDPAVPIDPDSEEVQQLESAAMPLLFELRDDQKVEVRKLARSIGLEKVAAAI